MTAPAPLVSVEELSGWLRVPLTGTDAEWAGLVLNAASALIRAEAGLTLDSEVPETIRAVTFAVAARVYRNPEAATSYSKTTGPYGKTISFADPTSVGLYLSDEEKRIVGRANTTRTRGLWTLATTRQNRPNRDCYVPTPDGQDIPWYDDGALW